MRRRFTPFLALAALLGALAAPGLALASLPEHQGGWVLTDPLIAFVEPGALHLVPAETRVEAFKQAIAASGYDVALGQFGVGRFRFGAISPMPPIEGGQGDLSQEAFEAWARTHLQADPQTLYLVTLPEGQHVLGELRGLNGHGYTGGVQYLVIQAAPTLGRWTSGASHEITEGATDPLLGWSWLVPSGPRIYLELADACPFDVPVAGVLLNSFMQRDGSCWGVSL